MRSPDARPVLDLIVSNGSAQPQGHDPWAIFDRDALEKERLCPRVSALLAGPAEGVEARLAELVAAIAKPVPVRKRRAAPARKMTGFDLRSETDL